jgi:hypothetical protein
VKVCSYCGRENNDEARWCSECATEFPFPRADEPSEAHIKSSPDDKSLADISQIDMGCQSIEGFSRPDWKSIAAFVNRNIPKGEWPAAWNFIAEKWLLGLAKDLGGASRVYESDSFFCLSDLDAAKTRSVTAVAESTVRQIRAILGKAAWSGFNGKHVLVTFADLDDYYSYISFYYPDGHHISTSGVFLRSGYAHIAFPYTRSAAVEKVVAHELVHNLLCHLRIPRWLNEGLASVIEGHITRSRFVLDQEMADWHAAHWNKKNIQAFWGGKSFDIPADDSPLAYHLSHILVALLSEKLNFCDFITAADWCDSGLAAALKTLNCDLGDVAAEFLGPGKWRPAPSPANITAKNPP